MSKAAAAAKKAPDTNPLAAAKIMKTDMPDAMLAASVEACKDALKECKVEKDMAQSIRKKMDALYPGANWHCIVGKHFGLALTHETRHMAFLNMGGYNICMFKAAEQ
jgi:dynein light chain LC8-type